MRLFSNIRSIVWTPSRSLGTYAARAAPSPQRTFSFGSSSRSLSSGASAIKCCYAAAGSGTGEEESELRAVPSIYSSARTELD